MSARDEGIFWIGFCVGTVLLFIATALMFSIGIGGDLKELGQAICEKEYNMDYVSYGDGILTCEPRPKAEEYDGIKVKIKGKGD